jgi:hypothetical protein
MKHRSKDSKHRDSRMTKAQQSDSQQLSIREQSFVEAYVVSTKGNGAAAVREAGYSVKNPDVYAAKLLGKERIRKAIARRRAELQRLADITAQEVISTLTAQMRGDITELLDENGNLDLAAVRRRKLGGLIKSISFSVSTGGGEARPYVSRVEMVSQQQAAIQLCKILHVERDKSDPTTLRRLLDERVAFARLQCLAKALRKLSASSLLQTCQRDSVSKRCLPHFKPTVTAPRHSVDANNPLLTS